MNNELGTSINNKKSCELIRAFVYLNFDPRIIPDELEENMGINYISNIKFFHHISKYIDKLHKENLENFNTFNDLVKGYIIKLSLGSSPGKNRMYKDITLYFDSNIIFFILGLHYSDFVEPTREMFNIINKFGFKLKVLDISVAEVRNYLNNCMLKHTPDLKKIDSICYYLKNKRNKTDPEIKQIAAHLEEALSRLNINIEETKIDLKSYIPRDESLLEEIRNIKFDQGNLQRLHDVAALEYIRKLRNDALIYGIENSGALFITSDRRLSKFNTKRHHASSETFDSIPEIIVDKALINILWLSDPSIDLKIDSLIASCCRDIFINHKIWDRFNEIFKELLNTGEVDDKDYATLMFRDYLDDILFGYSAKDVQKIDEQFVKDTIKNIECKIRDDTEKLKIEMGKEIQTKLERFFSKILYYFRTLLIGIICIHIIAMESLAYLGLGFKRNIILYMFLIAGIVVLSGIGPLDKFWLWAQQKIIEQLKNIRIG